MTPEPVVVVENLVKRFGSFVAVDDVSFAVSRGEIFGFLGPNGAGKTTTIRMLLGLLVPTSGRGSVLGYDAARESKAMQAHVGYMSQVFTLYPDLTAEESLRFYGRVYGLRRQVLAARCREILHMAGLAGREHDLTAHLSGGWKQRLALGCAIVHRPELVFLDEPTAGVDPVSRREFWALIYELARNGMTVFVTTHYMEEAEHCQRVGFMSEGRLVALGSPSELKAAHMRGQVLEISGADAEGAVRALRSAQARGLVDLEEVALYGAEVHAVAADVETARPAIADVLSSAGIAVRSINNISPSLEDVFISSVTRNR